MKHLQSHNEGLFNWRRRRGKKPIHRKFNKGDIYLSDVSNTKRIGPSKLNDENTFYAKSFPDLNLIEDHIIKRLGSKGVIGDFSYYRSDTYTFGGESEVNDTKVWFDVGDTFTNLRKISDDLGYGLNDSVHVKSTQTDSKIIEIVNFVFYNTQLRGLAMTRSLRYVFTLLYKVEGDDNYYQIGQLDRLEGESEKNIVDEVIEENFLELMDEGLIDFTSKEFTNKGKTAYKCIIKVSKDMNPEVLFKISECLLVAARRLNDMNIDIDIKSMNHVEDRQTRSGTTDIEFTAIQK